MEKNETQAQQQSQQSAILQPVINPTESMEFLMSPLGQQVKKFELTQRIALAYCKSTIVPVAYQGQQNVGNVFIALEMAERMNMNPIQVMQSLYVVYGNPSWSSSFLIARFNLYGKYTHISWETRGKAGDDSLGMRAFAYDITDKERKNPLYGPWVTIGIAKKEGWYDKKGSKWQTMPELMLRYRSASQFINTIAPEIKMGLPTTDEVEDTHVVDAEFMEIPENEPVADFQEVLETETKLQKTEEEAKTPQTQAQPTTNARTLFGDK